MAMNRKWILKERPTAALDRQCFEYREDPLESDPLNGAILLRHDLVLAAPTVRNFISARRDRHHPVVNLGEPVMAPAVSTVVASGDEKWPVGTRVVGSGRWSDYTWTNPAHGIRRLPPTFDAIDALGRLGVNAHTAYSGLVFVGNAAPGETLLVSGAGGSVGSTAAQIGRILGCKVVGICGGGAKADWLRSVCGIQDIIDYKQEDVPSRIDALCPAGIDVFFDNVGGPTLQAAAKRMRVGGRIVLCGQIATYDGAHAGEDGPPLDMMRLIYGRIRLQGFIRSDFDHRSEEMDADLRRWYDEGTLHHRLDLWNGFAKLPESLIAVLAGSNNGTTICQINDR